ncbi:hypothetical protein VZC37_16375 [Gordonia sp. LSe1-13]|uniref:Glycoprotein n=1 Tax=Gordonia sesuvii TaxID=3116777 RepID=A0ABU7MFN0_9ACTN|nr:hypothetical protein [Gordonia sp. LSe1-13]
MPDPRRVRLWSRLRRSAPTWVAILAVVGLCALAGNPAAGLADAAPVSDDVGDDSEGFLRLSIDEITPSIVTSSGGADVTVTGRLENIGDRMLQNLSIRVERGEAIDDAAGLRSSLAVRPVPVSAATAFRPLADELGPGDTDTFSFTTRLSAVDGLNIQRTGVFPINVNVNGLPDYGNPAKLAQSRTLLPVLSLPPDPTRAEQYVDPSTDVDGANIDNDLGADGSVSADLSSPAQLTMLWPLAAPPQLTPGVLGGNTEPVRLVGEDLARSLSAGGRLNTLLAAAASVAGEPTDGDDDTGDDGAGDDPGASETAPASPPASSPTESASPSPGSAPSSGSAVPTPDEAAPAAGQQSRLAQSMCLAVDPDLLVTVRAMSLGYVVSDDPLDPTSPTTPGTGQPAALQWLTELRELAAGMCVVALPFAQADLTSLSRVGDSGLTAAALSSPADIVDAVLGVRSVRGLAVPALGTVDATGAEVLQDASVGKAVTSTSSVEAERPNAAGGYQVGDLTVQTTEAPVTAALAALGANPQTTPLTPADEEVSFVGESDAARRQSAVAALAYPAIDAPGDTTPSSNGNNNGDATAGRGEFVVPPTYWAPSADDTNALFTTATLLLESGAATPAPLADVVTRLDETTTPARLVRPSGIGPLSALGMSVTDPVAAEIEEHAALSFQLQASLMSSADVAATPERYVAPLREDMLRAIRTPDTTSPALRAELRGQRAARLTAVDATLQRMRNAVTILDPGGRYTLASERSPLLLVVRNDLSLPIRVRIDVDAPPELDVGDLGVIEIPARGTRQIQLPTRAETSEEAITVTIGLTTSSGISVGSPIRLSVNANAYGKPLFWVTIAAGVALVLLVARRLWHRFRGEPDPADQDRPDPDEHDRLLARATYQERRRNLEAENIPYDDPDPLDAGSGVDAGTEDQEPTTTSTSDGDRR